MFEEKCSVINRGDNELEISYKAIRKGEYQLHIEAEGLHISGSPFKIIANKPGTPIKTLSEVKKPGGMSQMLLYLILMEIDFEVLAPMDLKKESYTVLMGNIFGANQEIITFRSLQQRASFFLRWENMAVAPSNLTIPVELPPTLRYT